MHNEEIIASFFLRLDEIVNHMRNMGENINENALIIYFLRYLTPKFE